MFLGNKEKNKKRKGEKRREVKGKGKKENKQTKKGYCPQGTKLFISL